MTRLRVFLAWILLAALPFQGYAAAAMSYCGASTTQTEAVSMPHQHAGDTHDSASAKDSAQQHLHVSNATGANADDAFSDTGHKCSLCAACGHSVAIAETPHAIAVHALPQPVRSEDFGVFPTRPAHVPDKPPRA